MKEFTAKFDKIVNEISTDIYIESAINPKERIKIKAIWDTGAVSTMITPYIAKQLNLDCISVTTINSITDLNIPANVYMVYLYLNNIKIDTFANEAKPINCDLLIGMDVISRGRFFIDNKNGKTKFTFKLKN